MATNWDNLTDQGKIDLVRRLRAHRIDLLEASKKKRRSKPSTSKRKAKKLSFGRPELDKLFNELPKELQAFIMEK